MKAGLLALSAALAWLTAAPAAGADKPLFVPERFFSGRSIGEGELRVFFGAPLAVHVRSRGRVLEDGTLVLVQRIEQEGEAPRERTWRLRAAGNGRYSGTLTDADGPVTGTVSGNTLTIRYTMKGRLRLSIRQSLELERDGRTIRNHLTASLLGLPLARLSETIQKLR